MIPSTAIISGKITKTSWDKRTEARRKAELTKRKEREMKAEREVEKERKTRMLKERKEREKEKERLATMAQKVSFEMYHGIIEYLRLSSTDADTCVLILLRR